MPSLSTSDSPAIHVRSSRRALLGYGLAGAALAAVRPATARATMSSPSPEGWRPWLLTSASELRPTTPAPPSADEIAEVLALQAKRTAATEDLVARWGARSAVLPWTELALELIAAHKPSPVRAGRALALLHTAVFDAVVATWDAKAAHRRAAPSTVDARIVPIGDATAGGSSFPSEHAAVAGTAATVLPSLFPDEPVDRLAALAEEAATSRLWAAACFGSDIDAGLALGRAVGERAVARGEADGSDRVWDGTGRPTGEGYWEPTPPAYLGPPLDPLAGTWQTWVLERGDQLRPAPPPTWGSPVWEAEMGAAREAVASRTAEQEAAVWFWAGTPGTVTPAGLWTEIARDLIVRDGLDLPHAARVLALTSVAMADAFICCWDAKYAYWVARPVTADPTLAVLIPTPPFPSYTSGHSTISAAAATVLGHLFPRDEAELVERAAEARQSRLWAGIHFPLDNEMGAVGGGLVGWLVVARAREDGMEVHG